jgi:hypothetical protein
VKLGTDTKTSLTQRGLFLRQGQTRTAVEICVADGSATGFLIGWVEKARHPDHGRRKVWRHHARQASTEDGYYRGRVRGVYLLGPLAGIESADAAMSEVLGAAEYGDVLADRERQSGRDELYVGTVGQQQADRLGSLEEPQGITNRGDGTVEFTNVALAYFRGSPDIAYCVDASYLLHLNPRAEPYQLTRER